MKYRRLHRIIIPALVILAAELAGLFIYGRMFLGHFHAAGFGLPSDLYCFQMNAAVALGLQPLRTLAAAGVTPYMNPPPFLLLAAPLASLSPLRAFALWSSLGIAAMALAGRAAKYSWPAIGLGLAAPAGLYCLVIGQNGEIVSSLLLLSLTLLKTTPVLAGIAAGCVIIKPQFALLLPVCFIASGSWRAFIAAALTVPALCILSVWAFGLSAWYGFFSAGAPLAHAVLDRPWPQSFQGIMVSLFITLRSLGASLALAYGVQLAATLGAALSAWHLWRPRSPVEMPMRVLVTLCLIPLATPYAYIYDLPGLALVLAGEAVRRQGRFMPALAMFWTVTALYILISMISFVVGGILLALLAVYLWPRAEDVSVPAAAAQVP